LLIRSPLARQGSPVVFLSVVGNTIFKLRIAERDPVLPIILMTAHETIQSAWEAGQLGVYYLTKPFATRELARLLTTVLRERRPQQGRNS
jgi:DNA-binding NtrC family response regulator